MYTSEIQDRRLGLFSPERIRRDERCDGEEQSEPWGLELGRKRRHQPRIQECPRGRRQTGRAQRPVSRVLGKGSRCGERWPSAPCLLRGGQLDGESPAGFHHENWREQPPGKEGKSLRESQPEKQWRSEHGQFFKVTAGILTSVDRKMSEKRTAQLNIRRS